MDYDEDLDICSDEDCSVCAPRRARRALLRDTDAPPAPSPMLREDGTLPVPDVIDASAILVAMGGDGTVTLTREDARRVVSTLAMRRAPDDVTTIDSLRTRLTEARDAHRRDIETIGTALMEEAEARDWCGIYDEVVEELNANLSVSLPLRARDVTIYLCDDDGRNHFYVSVSISGEEDEADAARQVLDAIRGTAAVNDWGYA